MLSEKTSAVGRKTESKQITRILRDFNKNAILLLFVAPMVVLIFVFNYIPMAGIIVAFKNFRYDQGIFGSKWVGLKNFEFFLTSPDAWRITRNTLGYNSFFIILSLICSVTIAVLLYEVTNKVLVKTYQTVMYIPHFLSWVTVAFMAYAFLNPKSGMLNQILRLLGRDTVNWYNKPEAWVLILPLANVWKTVGANAMLYYASLMSIDVAYYEAAKIEGATKLQATRYITLPFLYPLMIILTTLAIGKIFNADFGLFYQLPMNATMLYPTTDVIETYVYRALIEYGNIGMSSASGVYKSMVGLILVLITNKIVNKINPENALF